jgi:hypothetical protein
LSTIAFSSFQRFCSVSQARRFGAELGGDVRAARADLDADR